jgi:hypothetical protein
MGSGSGGAAGSAPAAPLKTSAADDPTATAVVAKSVRVRDMISPNPRQQLQQVLHVKVMRYQRCSSDT